MIRKMLIYGLPIYLVGLEILLRIVINKESIDFAGPTLGGSGLGILVTLTEHKEVNLTAAAQRALEARSARAFLSKDQKFIEFVWLMFLLMLAGWLATLYLSIEGLGKDLLIFPLPLIIGAVSYLIAIVSAEFKRGL